MEGFIASRVADSRYRSRRIDAFASIVSEERAWYESSLKRERHTFAETKAAKKEPRRRRRRRATLSMARLFDSGVCWSERAHARHEEGQEEEEEGSVLDGLRADAGQGALLGGVVPQGVNACFAHFVLRLRVSSAYFLRYTALAQRPSACAGTRRIFQPGP